VRHFLNPDQDIRPNREHLIRAAEAFPAAVVMTDSNGRIVLVNSLAECIFGYSHDELIGQAAEALMAVRYRAVYRHRRLNSILVSSDQMISLTLAGCRKDGDEFPIEVSLRSVQTDSGTLVIGAITDISARRQAERARLAVEEQLRHSQKMEAVGRLAESIVHDFNNLIAIILTQSELVMELEDIASICRETEVILNAADRAGALTRQLLAFSRKQAVQPRVFNLNDLLHNMDQMLGRLLPHDVEFNTLCSPDLGNILADPGQIEQVVMNLVVNARDAMPDGGRLTVETCNVELDELYTREHLDVAPGRYVMLTVCDTGIGMSEEVRSRLFEPFFTTKPPGEGTGLGLSTVYAIVKKSSGHVWLYSEPNRGTAFNVYFPRVTCAVESTKRNKGAVRAASRSAIILLVEDEERLRLSIQQLLERAGYVVLAAAGAAEAIQILDQNSGPIDLVLTDVGLPHIRGPELVECLQYRRPQMKALYMSGFGADSLRQSERAQLGGNLIQKPFHKEALLTQLARVLDVQDLPR
jgi:PAS domain S-box-containing protein